MKLYEIINNYQIIYNEDRTWEARAIRKYRGDKRYNKAVAAGKSIDGALNKVKSKFLTEVYLKYF
jgi:hypothetical protein